jgi:hypothetical protein
VKVLLSILTVLGTSGTLWAQTLTDGVMMPRQDLCTGFVYEHDRWSEYWEGTLKRDNQNIGSLTTRSVTWMGNYGVTDKINVIAMLPYISTGASQGVLHGMKGVQDLTLAVKYQALTTSVGSGSLKAFAVGSVALPIGNYTPDFYPMSIGSGSRRASGRLTLNYATRRGFFATGSGAYTGRANVTLDRGAYYTDGHLYYSDEVAMPGVIDYTFSVGYRRNRLMAPLSFSQMHTLGGGDIRRQDMPFVSNRMNVSRVDAGVLYYVPKVENLALKLGVTRTLTGRNVGQATTLQGGVMYTFHFGGPRS